MREIRRGRKPTIGRLLEEMQRDYHDNAQLRMIREDPDFRGRWK